MLACIRLPGCGMPFAPMFHSWLLRPAEAKQVKLLQSRRGFKAVAGNRLVCSCGAASNHGRPALLDGTWPPARLVLGSSIGRRELFAEVIAAAECGAAWSCMSRLQRSSHKLYFRAACPAPTGPWIRPSKQTSCATWSETGKAGRLIIQCAYGATAHRRRATT